MTMAMIEQFSEIVRQEDSPSHARFLARLSPEEKRDYQENQS